MKKKESTLVNMVVVLFAITLVAGLSLGYVNELTLEPKAKAKLAKKMDALSVVLPDFDNNPIDDVIRTLPQGAIDSIELYPAYREREFIGAAVTAASDKGYSGLVRLMVGFDTDGRIVDIAVLQQKETPGLGTKMKDERFLRQFRGENPTAFRLEVEKDGGDVDALAGATISSRAFTEAVQQAFDTYLEKQEVLTEPKN